MTEVSIKQQRKFSIPSDYDAFCVNRLHNSVLASLGGRNQWVSITSASGQRVYRTIRGSGSIPYFPNDGMELDYETSISLGIPRSPSLPTGMYACELRVRPATRWQCLVAHWRHPDPAYRFPLQLSLVSLVLGVVGLVLGTLSLR